MKKHWYLFGIALSVLFSIIFWQTTLSASHEKLTSLSSRLISSGNSNHSSNGETAQITKRNTFRGSLNLADSVIALGLKRIGTPYKVAGITDEGFDCSGFVSFIFGKAGISVPHSSALLAETGKSINRKEARKGDVLIFTGTNEKDRNPGHVGIVISNPGEMLTFVHSSSNGGVKISQVETTNYENRFLEARRVL